MTYKMRWLYKTSEVKVPYGLCHQVIKLMEFQAPRQPATGLQYFKSLMYILYKTASDLLFVLIVDFLS